MNYECKMCGSNAPLAGSCPGCGIPGSVEGRPMRLLGKSEVERLRGLLKEACDHWESHLKGAIKRAIGGEDGGYRMQRERIAAVRHQGGVE